MLSATAQALRARWSPRYLGLVVAPIALTLLAWGAYDAAFAQYRDVLSRLQNTLGPEHAYCSINRQHLGRVAAV